MLISDLLQQKRSFEVEFARADSGLIEAAGIMDASNIGFLIVLDASGRLTGVISERDIARSLARFREDIFNRTVEDVMTRSLVTCSPTDHVIDILGLMTERNIRHVPVLEGNETLAVLSIKEFNHAYEKLQAEARIDYLTGLANRRYFMEALEAEISRRRRHPTLLSLAMIDLDHFKSINDRYGHDAGDKVLCAFSRLLRRQLRQSDVIGRLGGEEFAILFNDTDLEGATLVCNRIADATRHESVVVGDVSIDFTASFGVLETTDWTDAAGYMLSQADMLLYEAKETGRDRVVSRPILKTSQAAEASVLHSSRQEIPVRSV